jgi:hypothetical protein
MAATVNVSLVEVNNRTLKRIEDDDEAGKRRNLRYCKDRRPRQVIATLDCLTQVIVIQGCFSLVIVYSGLLQPGDCYTHRSALLRKATPAST